MQGASLRLITSQQTVSWRSSCCARVADLIADDIVRARVRTLGVEEHQFTMENGALSRPVAIFRG